MDEILDYLSARRIIYSLLGVFFYKEADNTYLEALKRIMPVIRTMGVERDIREAVQGADMVLSVEEGADFEDGAAKEFAAVFLISDVLNGVKPVTPHESVYLSLSGMTMQDERDQVMEEYFREGLGRDKSFKEPEDHIKAELDFMAFLSGKSLEAAEKDEPELLEESIGRQIAFMSGHIEKWIYRLCADVRNCSHSAFFKGMSFAAEGFIKADRLFLKDLGEVIKSAEA